jgi:TolB protein
MYVPGGLTRRRAVCIGAAAGMAVFAGVEPSRARFFIPDLTLTNIQPIPIALPDFLAGRDVELARSISQIITANLKRGGRFTPIDQAAFIEKITNFDVVPRFPDWRAINAQALVTGRIARLGDGRISVAFLLWDVSGGAQLAGQQYFSTPDNFRRIAHIISDVIYERLTGEKGNFESSASP